MERTQSLEFRFTYYPLMIGATLCFYLIYRVASPWFSARYVPKYSLFTKSIRVEWNSRIVSTIHAIIVCTFSLYELLLAPDLVKEPIWSDRPLVWSTCAIMTGFGFSDSLGMFMDWKQNMETFTFYFHHLAVLCGNYIGMSYGVLGYFGVLRFLAEFSTPFVNQRWFLDVLGYKESNSYFINGLLMTFFFVATRVACIPFYWYAVYKVYNTREFLSLGYITYIPVYPCIVLDILNICWCTKMLRGAYKVLLRKMSKNSKSSNGHNGKLS